MSAPTKQGACALCGLTTPEAYLVGLTIGMAVSELDDVGRLRIALEARRALCDRHSAEVGAVDTGKVLEHARELLPEFAASITAKPIGGVS